MAARLEDLAIFMYEYGFLELEDVGLYQVCITCIMCIRCIECIMCSMAMSCPCSSPRRSLP